MRIGRKSLTLSIIAVFLVAAMAIGPVYASGTLFVNPSSIIDPTVTAFSITVEIDAGVLNLWGYEFKLLYNTAVLTATGYTLSTDFPDVAYAQIDDGAGLCWFAASLPSFPPPIYGIDGPTTLVTIDFTVDITGDSRLDIDEDYTMLINLPGEVLDVAIGDGYFRNGAPQLWIREKGAHGGGVWPAWHVGSIGEPQVLYAKIPNTGDMAVMIQVELTIFSEYGVDSETSNELLLGAGETGTVYAVYTTPGPGQYVVKGDLYFKWDGGDYIEYSTVVPEFGGIGTTRDIATKFKVG